MKNKPVYLVVTIDTEEDNWGIHRSGVTTKNIQELVRLQQLFDKYSIRPTYLVTLQVAMSEKAAEILRTIRDEGKCEIGAHLHPWNTPPLVENMGNENSMLGNLPTELQREKLKTFLEQFQKSFGTKPKSFRAGRWGLRRSTIDLLEDFEFKIDSSLTPLTSWEEEGLSKVFDHYDTEPCWLCAGADSGIGGKMLEIPVSIGYNRWPPKFWDSIYNHLKNPIYKPFHPLGILHLIGVLRKIWLSPEVSRADDMIKLAKLMMAKGKSVLNFTFHTPSLLAGCGPFVRDAKELDRFYNSIEAFLRFVADQPRIRSITLSEAQEMYASHKTEERACKLMLQ